MKCIRFCCVGVFALGLSLNALGWSIGANVFAIKDSQPDIGWKNVMTTEIGEGFKIYADFDVKGLNYGYLGYSLKRINEFPIYQALTDSIVSYQKNSINGYVNPMVGGEMRYYNYADYPYQSSEYHYNSILGVKMFTRADSTSDWTENALSDQQVTSFLKDKLWFAGSSGQTRFEISMMTNPVPEPMTLLVVGSGIVALMLRRKR